MGGKERIWLQYFNPCGAEFLDKRIVNTCISPDCGKLPCLARTSYQLAESFIDGRDEQSEQEELKTFLQGLVGEKVISPEGETIKLNQDNLDEIVTQIIGRAKKTKVGVAKAIEKTVPISQELVESLPQSQQQVLNKVYKVYETMKDYDGSDKGAKRIYRQMRNALAGAIKSGLGNIDVIARQSFVYGLWELYPNFDETGLMIKGKEEILQKKPNFQL